MGVGIDESDNTVTEQFYLVGFHQCFYLGVGQQLLKHRHGVDMVTTAFEPVAHDGVSDFDA